MFVETFEIEDKCAGITGSAHLPCTGDITVVTRKLGTKSPATPLERGPKFGDMPSCHAD
jgi:hypothetical protein